MNPINSETVPGSTVIPTWVLLAAIGALYAVDVFYRIRREDRLISLAERVASMAEAALGKSDK